MTKVRWAVKGAKGPACSVLAIDHRKHASLSLQSVTRALHLWRCKGGDLLTSSHRPYVDHPAKALNLRRIWQMALLDSFLVTWLPEPLVREYTSDNESRSMVPMSAWPLVTWKLAKRNDESFVAHSLLCLIFCTLGARTGNLGLIGEASRHYARVLQQFQSQVARLARSGYSAKQDDLVASLAAAGFCCSQVEYILQSWSNGDRHLQGIASLLQVCGPLCLKHRDTQRIFYDHCLLWISCSVVHRRPSIYSRWLCEGIDWTETMSSCDPARKLLTIAARIPSILEAYDISLQRFGSTQLICLLQRFSDVVVDMEVLELSSTSVPDSTTNDSSLSTVIMKGYASAFLIHVLVALRKIVQSLSFDSPPAHYMTADQLYAICEHHATKLRSLIDRLTNEHYGMITTSPLLFFVDSAQIGYVALAKCGGRDRLDIGAWFTQISDQLTRRGYRPLRELGYRS